MTIAAGQTLTLDNDTLTGVALSDNGTIKVDAGQTLTLSASTITGGVVGNSGTLNISEPSTLTNTTLNGGQVTVDVPFPNLTATDQGTVVQFTGTGFDAARVSSPAVTSVNGDYVMLFAGEPSGNGALRLDWRLRATARTGPSVHRALSSPMPTVRHGPRRAKSRSA